jgi:hypothetical protein
MGRLFEDLSMFKANRLWAYLQNDSKSIRCPFQRRKVCAL